MKEGGIMKRMRSIFAIMAAVVICSHLSAQTDIRDFVNSAKATVERGSLISDIGLLAQGRSMFERALAVDPENQLLQYHLAYVEYRMLIYYLQTENDDFRVIAEQCEKRLESLLRNKPGWPEAQALLSGVYGLSIARNWTRGMTVGPKANRLAQQAVDSDPGNPRAWLMHGSQKLHTPPMFGGSLDDAVQAFERAIELYEDRLPGDPMLPEWGYADALTWLGIAYERQDRYDEALSAYHKVLDVVPDFSWVKYDLLPNLERKLAGR
jgi:tetratricopeptide (TPR) repeat protein